MLSLQVSAAYETQLLGAQQEGKHGYRCRPEKINVVQTYCVLGATLGALHSFYIINFNTFFSDTYFIHMCVYKSDNNEAQIG